MHFQKHNHKQSRKLNFEDVRQIRRRYAEGETQRELCQDFHVSIGTIGRIVRGEGWLEKESTRDQPRTADQELLDNQFDAKVIKDKMYQENDWQTMSAEEQERIRKLGGGVP